MKIFFLLFLITTNLSAQTVFHKKIKASQSYNLDNKLHETSGLVHYNNRFWTHNDDTDCNLYALDTLSGKIIETYNLPNTTNTDWEEIAQDETYFYIGDFGNNATGNRNDLHILKIEKQSLLDQNPIIEQINFTYSNQKNTTSKKPNKTNFDCEAMVVVKDSIYLFTKEWKTKKTTLYSLPKKEGSYVAYQNISFKIKGLVTGASYFEPKKQLALCGYSKKGKPFIQIFYDFKGNNFFEGEKRKFKLKPRFQQIEAITTMDGIHYYLTNESFNLFWINRLAKLQLYQLDFK